MFKKICFLLSIVSMIFSSDSFARKSITREQNLEKKSLVRAQAHSRRNSRTERPAVKRRVVARHLREKPSITRNSRITAVRMRQNLRDAFVAKRTALRGNKRSAQKNADIVGNINVGGAGSGPFGFSMDKMFENESFFNNGSSRGVAKKDSFAGQTTLKDVKKDSLSVAGPFEFSNIEVNNHANISGSVSKSKTGKFNSLNISGSFEATDVTCQKLKVSGSVIVSNLNVENDVKISGSLIATDMTCKQLDGSGSVVVTNLKVGNETNLSGSLNATQSHLHNLNIASNEIVLKDTIVEGNIIVKKIWGNQKQVLRLQGSTNVTGTITFESGMGTIEQGPGARVLGTIKGAILHQN